MLPKKNRLKKQKDFEEVFKRGRSFKESFLILRVLQNDKDLNRFGFVVSKKVSKKAVERNRIKRLLREAVKSQKEEYRRGFDVVFITLPFIKNKKFNQIQKAVQKILIKSEILKHDQ